jgi:hypothetical protein
MRIKPISIIDVVNAHYYKLVSIILLQNWMSRLYVVRTLRNVRVIRNQCLAIANGLLWLLPHEFASSTLRQIVFEERFRVLRTEIV